MYFTLWQSSFTKFICFFPLKDIIAVVNGSKKKIMCFVFQTVPFPFSMHKSSFQQLFPPVWGFQIYKWCIQSCTDVVAFVNWVLARRWGLEKYKTKSFPLLTFSSFLFSSQTSVYSSCSIYFKNTALICFKDIQIYRVSDCHAWRQNSKQQILYILPKAGPDGMC